MEEEIKLNNSGWYYDSQLNNEMQSISLHANQRLKTDAEKVGKYTTGSFTVKNMNGEFLSQMADASLNEDYNDWKPFDQNECDTDLYVSNFKDENIPVCGYCKKPICKAILYEDFNISAANIWSDFGSNVVGALWDATRQTAPMTSFLSEAFGVGREMTLENMKTTDNNKEFKEKLANVLGILSGSLKKTAYYQNRSLVVTGTQMSLYSGTGFDYSNMGMRFTIFPEISATGIKTVPEQLEEMYPYFIGRYKKDEAVGKLLSELSKTLSAKNYDISEFIGWQNPPGGYEASLRSIDTITKGTLKLRIGSQYSIPNLVVQSAVFTFSKQMVKFPDISGKLTLSPLFCEVNLVLHPVSKYSSQSLRRIIDSGKITDRPKELEKKINEKLSLNITNNSNTLGRSSLLSYTTREPLDIDHDSEKLKTIMDLNRKKQEQSDLLKRSMGK